MSTEEHKAVVRRFVEVQSQGRLDVIDQVIAPDFINHTAPPGVPPTREGARQLMALFRAAFPDGHMTIEDMLAEGDKVVTRKTFHGIHQGEFMGIPPDRPPGGHPGDRHRPCRGWAGRRTLERGGQPRPAATTGRHPRPWSGPNRRRSGHADLIPHSTRETAAPAFALRPPARRGVRRGRALGCP